MLPTASADEGGLLLSAQLRATIAGLQPTVLLVGLSAKELRAATRALQALGGGARRAPVLCESVTHVVISPATALKEDADNALKAELSKMTSHRDKIEDMSSGQGNCAGDIREYGRKSGAAYWFREGRRDRGMDSSEPASPTPCTVPS